VLGRATRCRRVLVGNRKPGKDGKLSLVGYAFTMVKETWANTDAVAKLAMRKKTRSSSFRRMPFRHVRVTEIRTSPLTANDQSRFGVMMSPDVLMEHNGARELRGSGTRRRRTRPR
jgi:hypothetical protein